MFEEDCRDGTLPEYSLWSRVFRIEPNDQHPPHDVSLGEQFSLRIWKTVSGWPKMEQHAPGDYV